MNICVCFVPSRGIPFVRHYDGCRNNAFKTDQGRNYPLIRCLSGEEKPDRVWIRPKNDPRKAGRYEAIAEALVEGHATLKRP